MSEAPIIYDRAELRKGEKLYWDFKFANKLKTGTTLTSGNITLSVSPALELTLNAAVAISGLTVQVLIEAGTTAIANKEYEVTIEAAKDGQVATLKLIVMVRPA